MFVCCFIDSIVKFCLSHFQDLANLIDLDFSSYDLFDLPPLNEYELYVRNFGNSNAAQASTQTNDDQTDRDVQTEDWEVKDSWVQAPSAQLRDCGTEKTFLPWLQSLYIEDEETNDVAMSRPINSKTLLKFLRGASQVMDVLLEENIGDSLDDVGFKGKAAFPFSRGQADLVVPEFLKGRYISDMCFHPSDHRTILIAWDSPQPIHPSVTNMQSALLIWRVNQHDRPLTMLFCKPRVTCCCFAPSKPHLIFAGTLDGSIQVWDLTEANSDHRTVVYPGAESDGDLISVRIPSYSTDGLYTKQRVHEHSIVKLNPLHKYEKVVESEEAHEDRSEAFQICSSDSLGVVQIWSVVELEGLAVATQLDFGMRLKSRVKLIRASHFKVQNPDRSVISHL